MRPVIIILFALTYLDLLSPGRLVGELRVAGTRGIGPDGRVLPVSHVEVKVAAALLAHPNVVFTPRPSKMIDQATIFKSVPTRPYGAGDSVSDWLHLGAYGEAGRQAGQHARVTAFVVVHDIRQVLAWLCGRTGDRQVRAGAAVRGTSRPDGPYVVGAEQLDLSLLTDERLLLTSGVLLVASMLDAEGRQDEARSLIVTAAPT